MDHIRILRRAFSITRFYPALWVFGILLALTGAGGSSGSGSGTSRGTSSWRWDGNFPRDWPRNWPNFRMPEIPTPTLNTIMGIGIAVICFVLLLAVIFTILHYVSNTALVRMVDASEASGEKVTVGRGFRLGWSRASFRSWLAALLVGIGGFLAVLLVILIAAAPLLLWLTGDQTARVVGTVLAVGLGLLAIIAIIVFVAALSVVMELAYRAIVLENLGAIDGIRRGWAIFRRRLGDSIIMGLILFGIRIGYSILMIPVALLLVLAGLVIGGIPALLAGAITNIFVHGATPQIVAAAVGIPLFVLVLVLPLTFLSGLYETFRSSTWTIAFREMLALEAVQPPAPPVEALSAA